MPGPGRKPATDATLRDAALVLHDPVDPAQRQVGERAHVQIEHGEAAGAVELGRLPPQAEARIVTT